jgi:hypothetical protein
MVKNTTGGSKSKGLARKNFVKGSSNLRVSEDEAEIYVQVTKVLGGPMCHVVDLKGNQMLCHIRGKFRGRGKRDNFISATTWLLVGLRDWEGEKKKDKLLNCDVIEVYSDSDKSRLKNTLLHIDWNLFVANDTKMIGPSETEDEVVFTDEKTQEYQDLIESQLKFDKTFTEEDDEEINVDDI